MATDRSNPDVAADGRRHAGAVPGAVGIDVITANGLVTVVVRGDIDAVAAPELREALTEVVDRGPTTVRIDMAAVDFLDSVGISVLVESFNRAQDAGVGFELASVPPSSLRVLEITRLTDIFTILD